MPVNACPCDAPGWCEEFQMFLSPRLHAICMEDSDRGMAARRAWSKTAHVLRDSKAVSATPATVPAMAAACVHRGAQVGAQECPSCNGRVQLKLFECAVHGRCTTHKKISGAGCCDGCPETKAPTVVIGRDMTVADLMALLGGKRDGWPADWFNWEVTTKAHAAAWRTFRSGLIRSAPSGTGRGIVICAGGWRFFASLYVTASVIRHVGCTLPIQAWYLGDNGEYDPAFAELTAELGVEWIDANEVARRKGITPRTLNTSGWVLKPFAVLHSPFAEVLSLDADSYPATDPTLLFDDPRYRKSGAIFWPDIGHGFGAPLQPGQWTRWGLPDHREPDFESGQLLVDKSRGMAALHATWWLNDHSDYVYRHYYGDKSTWHLGWRGTGTDYCMAPPARWNKVAFLQHDLSGKVAFVHRCRDKFRLPGDWAFCTRQNHTVNIVARGLPHEKFCHETIAKLRERVKELPPRTAPAKVPTVPDAVMPQSQKATLPLAFEPPANWTPEISIVMPVYNGMPFLTQALDSILAQSFRDFELICVDDGSLDETPAVLLDYATRDARVSAYRKPNGGTGSALNLGFKRARGRYQTWWSADSWVEPGWLEILRAELEAHPDAVLAYSDWNRYLHETGVTIREHTLEHDPEHLRRECYVGCCWMWRREAKEQAGDFDLRLCEDYDMHLRLADLGPFVRVPKMLGTWREHSSNLSATQSTPGNWRHSDQVKARRRWRQGGIRVLQVCPNIDPAGVAWRLWRGLTDWSHFVATRQVVGDDGLIGIGYDLRLGHDDAEARGVVAEADVIHCHMADPEEAKGLELLATVKAGKRLIIHLHGGQWAWNKSRVNELHEKYDAMLLTCTPYLAARFPGARWMPNYMPILRGDNCTDAYLYRPDNNGKNRSGPVRFICHHNYAGGKGILQVDSILKALQKQGVPFESEVKWETSLPLNEHLKHVRRFDVLIDTICQGFIGMCGWQAMAQGLPVIAYVDEFSAEAYAKLGDGQPPPIVNCRRPEDLADAVKRLAADRGEVERIGRASREWMLTHYHAQRIVGMYESIYREVTS